MFKPRPVVRSHWHHTFDGFETSALDFYGAVEAAVASRRMPNSAVSRVEWQESGVLSARRQYLRVERGPLAFDICTAPFGTGQFFSSWLAEMVPSPLMGMIGILCYTVLDSVLGAGILFLISKIHVALLLIAAPVAFLGFFLVFGVICLGIREGKLGGEEELRAVPLIGRLYDAVFAPDTYYRVDTMMMFQDLVHSSVLECVDQVTASQGVRSISGDEPKLTMRDVLDRRRW